jgi:VanZ family protein
MTGSLLQKISQNRWTAVAWTAVIFLLMILPKSGIPNQGLFGIPHLDKLVHAVMFGLFVWLWFQAASKDKKKPARRMAWMLFLVAIGYGTAMEFVQHYFTDRDFDNWDILADTAGALVAWILIDRG